MKLITLLTTILVLFFSVRSTALEIKHITSIDEILPHLSPNDLIVFDLDETLITHAHGEHWLGALCKEKNVTFDHVRDYYFSHAMLEDYRLLEEHAGQVIAQLQQQGYKIIGLTARSTKRLVDYTRKQLHKLGIDFSRSGIAQQDFEISGLEYPAFYHKGIISASDNNKGVVLGLALSICGFTPERIIFVDDKIHHAENMHHVMQSKNIPCKCFRFARTDGTVVNLTQADHMNYHAWFDGMPVLFPR